MEPKVSVARQQSSSGTSNTLQNPQGKDEEGQGGTHVLVDHCLICNQQCYISSKGEKGSKKRISELRALFYTVYEIPVSSAFIKTCSEDLPLCSQCVFKLGKLQVLQDQLTLIQKEYIKLREGIAFSIVDVVAASNGGDVWGSMELRTLPTDVIQRYLKQSEVDTLQHIIFDEWHERYSTDLDEEFDLHSLLPNKDLEITQPKVEDPSTTSSKKSLPAAPVNSPEQRQKRKVLEGTRPSTSTQSVIKSPSTSPSAAALSAIPKSLINGAADATATVQSDKSGRKTTVISITTHDDAGRGTKRTAPSGSTNVKKRKIESTSGDSQENKSKSVQQIVVVDEDEDHQENIDSHQQENDGGMVISMSPGQFHGEGQDNEPEYYSYPNDLDDGEHEVAEVYEPSATAAPQSKRVPKRRNTTQQNGHSTRESGDWMVSPDEQSSEIDYENMSLGQIAELLGDNTEVDEDDPERQKYLANIIAQLQAGGNNIEFQQNEEGLFVCMFCNKTFIHKYPYRDHLKTHTGEGPRCPVCNKIFPKNHNLMLHLRTHTGEKPFKCDVCEKGFADKSNLKVHYRVHTGEKPYKCDYCDQAFVNSSRLVVHRRLHTGERPFPCDICGKSFSTSNQLGAHKKIHGIDSVDDAGEAYYM